MDANLAEVDIESFKTEDIHALLTTLPPMCTDHFSQEVITTSYMEGLICMYLLFLVEQARRKLCKRLGFYDGKIRL